jgi:cytochrome c biogenesis protein ResB
MITIVILALNTLTCTIKRLITEGGINAFKGPNATRNAGFLLLHLSIILLLTGAFISAATRLDGFIVLTEGQTFTEDHDGYIRISEGRFSNKTHKNFTVTLEQVNVKFGDREYPLQLSTKIKIRSTENKIIDGVVEVNRPFKYQGFSFTHDQTGFSPRILIRDRKANREFGNSFIALKTFIRDQSRQYSDFLPMSIFKNRIVLTLYPSHEQRQNKIVKTGENPDNPIILIEEQDESGEVLSQTYLLQDKEISIGGYDLGFTDLRRWSSFKVSNDPGYPVVYVALWLGLVALIMRYLPDLRAWFKDEEKIEPPPLPVV